MSFYDRQYSQDPPQSAFGAAMQNLFPTVTPVVRWLLILNILVFIPSFLIPSFKHLCEEYLAVLPISAWYMIQLWRPITYQFLHDGFFHIFFNMLVLFFFGPMLEQVWGSRRFAFFYLGCGAAGGILFTLLVIFHILGVGVMVGASGAIYGLLAAGAILFPNLRVYVMGVFPMPLSVLAILLVVFSVLNFLGGQNAGGEAAHLAGMAAGALYVVWRPWMDRIRVKRSTGNWQKRLDEESRLRKEVDRILDKVHAYGIQSLTWREKRTLKKATTREQQEQRKRT
jgi:membrane associated rhomboid family serine protease